jgi:hypothetical protein
MLNRAQRRARRAANKHGKMQLGSRIDIQGGRAELAVPPGITPHCYLCEREAKSWPCPEGGAPRYGILGIMGDWETEPFLTFLCESCFVNELLPGFTDAIVRKRWNAPDLVIDECHRVTPEIIDALREKGSAVEH